MPASYRFDRGFTSHEHLDNFGLINMNGRIYDYYTAMFLSPDPVIDGASSSLGFNSYNYVSGNPMSFTDPSGYFQNNDAYLQSLIETSGGGGFWYRGNYYRQNDDGVFYTNGWFGYSSHTLNLGNGWYDWTHHTYRDRYGREIPFEHPDVQDFIRNNIELEFTHLVFTGGRGLETKLVGARLTVSNNIYWINFNEGTVTFMNTVTSGEFWDGINFLISNPKFATALLNAKYPGSVAVSYESGVNASDPGKGKDVSRGYIIMLAGSEYGQIHRYKFESEYDSGYDIDASGTHTVWYYVNKENPENISPHGASL